MKKNKTLLVAATGVLAAAALNGLIAGSAHAVTPNGIHTRATSLSSAGNAASTFGEEKTGKHDCKGQNECKGKGGCKSGDNGCKGSNSCKGKGGCKS